MSLINFDAKLKSLDGKITLKMKIDGTDQEIDLKTICTQSLISSADNPNKPVSVDNKLKYYELARKIYKGGKIEFTSEEIASIKEVVGEFPSILIVAQVHYLLEGKDPFKNG